MGKCPRAGVCALTRALTRPLLQPRGGSVCALSAPAAGGLSPASSVRCPHPSDPASASPTPGLPAPLRRCIPRSLSSLAFLARSDALTPVHCGGRTPLYSRLRPRVHRCHGQGDPAQAQRHQCLPLYPRAALQQGGVQPYARQAEGDVDYSSEVSCACDRIRRRRRQRCPI